MIKLKKNLSDQRRIYYHHVKICFKSCIRAIINTTYFCAKPDNRKLRGEKNLDIFFNEIIFQKLRERYLTKNKVYKKPPKMLMSP